MACKRRLVDGSDARTAGDARRADAAIRADCKGDDDLAAPFRCERIAQRAPSFETNLARIVRYGGVADLAVLRAAAAGLPAVAFFLAVRLPAPRVRPGSGRHCLISSAWRRSFPQLSCLPRSSSAWPPAFQGGFFSACFSGLDGTGFFSTGVAVGLASGLDWLSTGSAGFASVGSALTVSTGFDLRGLYGSAFALSAGSALALSTVSALVASDVARARAAPSRRFRPAPRPASRPASGRYCRLPPVRAGPSRGFPERFRSTGGSGLAFGGLEFRTFGWRVPARPRASFTRSAAAVSLAAFSLFGSVP